MHKRYTYLAILLRRAAAELFVSAVRETAPDGHPVVTVAYDCDIDAIELVKKIQAAITGGVAAYGSISPLLSDRSLTCSLSCHNFEAPYTKQSL